eukprot:403340963
MNFTAVHQLHVQNVERRFTDVIHVKKWQSQMRHQLKSLLHVHNVLMAHNSYVTDYTTGTCKYCGEYCSSCNYQYGCESCPGEVQNKGWISALTLDTSLSYYNTFKQCKQCDNPKICAKCSSSNSATCTQCYDIDSTSVTTCSRFSFTTYQTSALCTQTKVSNQGVVTCTQCQDGYFLKQGDPPETACLPYTGSGMCMEASSQSTCEICSYGYDEISVSGSQVCGNCQTLNTFYPNAIRCNQSPINTPTTLKACRDGYINNSTGQCVSKCPSGQYGLALFNRRGTVESTYCVPCNSSCYECNNGTGDCSSCKKGFYLDVGSTRRKSIGACKAKTTTSSTNTYYVNAYDKVQNTKAVDSIAGSSSDSFNTIFDALRKAYDIAARYETYTVKILLKSGTHAMLREPNAPQYMPQYIDQYSSGLNLIIDSQDGTQITVQYKMRDNWTFLVGRSLTINNLIFDAIDSIITPKTDQTNCLRQGPNCCSVDPDTNLLMPPEVCYFREKPTEECVTVTSGGALFTFEQHPLMALTTPANLTLNNCIFRNFMYEFNSLIELNDLGGYVQISKTQFQNINTCGAIIRNKKVIYRRDDLTQNSFPNVYETRVNNYQSQLKQASISDLGSFNPYVTCSTSFTSPCFQINIWFSTFENFGSQKDSRSAPVWVNPQYKMQYYGQILDLDSFKGHISIFSSTFQTNKLKFDDCDVGRQIKNNVKTGFVDRFPSLGSKTVIQMKSLISVSNHDYRIDIVENLARGNQGQSIYTTIPDSETTQFCTGYLFDRNTINNNAGCPFYSGGAFHMQCVDYDQQSNFANDTFTQASLLPNKNAYLAMSFVYKEVLQTVSIVTSGRSYSLDYTSNNFRQNQYKYNTVSGGFSLIDIVGFPRVNLTNEHTSNTGDSCKEFVIYNVPNTYTATANLISITDMMKNNALYPGYMLSQGILKIAKTSWVDIKNITFYYSFIIETSYDSKRSNAINFQEFYGKLNFDRFNFQFLYGVFNGFVTTTLAAAILLNDDRQYGCGYPLMRFNKDDRVDVYFTSNIVSTSSFGKSQITGVYFMTQSYNEYNIFPNFSDQNGIYAKQVNFNSMQISSYQCYSCKTATFEFSCDSVVLNDIKIYDINEAKTSPIKYLSGAPMITFRVKKPYINSLSVLITPTVTISLITAYNVYYDSGGRLWDFEYSSTTNEQEPTDYQVKISNIQTSYEFDTYGSGGLMRLNLDTIRLNFQSAVLTDIAVGWNNTNKVYGGLILVESVGYLYLDKITINNMYASQNSTAGGGRFLYYNQNKTFQLSVSNSQFTCVPSFSTDTTIKPLVNQLKYDQGSVFQINTQLKNFEGIFTNNTFSDCPRAQLGSGLSIFGNNKRVNKITLNNNTFTNNYALFGGAIYCEYCQFLQFYNNTFLTNYAYQGGDIYLVNPTDNPLILDSNKFKQSSNVATQPGGSIMIIDNVTLSSQVLQIQIITSDTSSPGYFSGVTASHGAILAVNTTGSIQLTFSNINIESITATSTTIPSGLININFTDVTQTTASTQLTAAIIFTDCNINTVTGIGGNIVEIRNRVNSSSITLENTNLLSILGSSVGGGAFRQLAIQSNTFQMNGGYFQDSYSNGNGGALFLKGVENSVILSNAEIIKSQSLQGSGGFLYMEGDGAQSLQISQLDAQNLYSQLNAGFACLKGKSIIVQIEQDTMFTTSYSQENGGLLYLEALESATLTISDFQISYIQAISGGLAYVKSNTFDLTISNTYLEYFDISQSGGAIYVESETASSYIILSETYIESISSPISGGFIHNEAKQQTYIFDTVSMNNIYSNNGSGGFIYAQADTSLNLKFLNSIITNFKADILGSFVYHSYSDSVSDPTSITSTILIQNSTLNKTEDELWKSFPTNYNIVVNDLIAKVYYTPVAFSIQEKITCSITSIDNQYFKSYGSNQGSLFNLSKNTIFSDSNSKFEQLSAIQGGVAYCDSCSMTFTGSQFIDIIAFQGGLVYSIGNSQLVFNNIHVNNIKSFGNGGLVYIEKSENDATFEASLTIQNSEKSWTFIESQEKGGFIYSNHPGLTLILQNLQIQGIYAQKSGGFLYLESLKFLTLTNITIKNITSSQGIMIYSRYNAIDFSLQQINVQCYSYTLSSQLSGIQSLEGLNIQDFSGSLFDIQGAQSVKSLQNKFQNCFIASQGAVFNLQNVPKFIDYSSSFIENYAVQGGAIYLQNVPDVTFNLTNFTGNVADQGGSIMQMDNVKITFENVQMNQCVSYLDGGFIYVQEGNANDIGQTISFIGTNNQISTCQSISGNGGCFYLDSKNIDLILTTHMTITNVKAGLSGGFIYSKLSRKLYLHNLIIKNASSSVSGGAVLFSSYQNTEIELQNLQVQCQAGTILQKPIVQSFSSTTYSNGAAFHIIDSEYLIETTSNTIEYCQNSQNGAAYYLQNSKLSDTQNSIYQYNSAQNGGVFYCQNCTIQSSYVTFEGNYAQNGGVIYALDSINTTFNGIIATNNYASQSASILYSNTQEVQQSSLNQGNIIFGGVVRLENNWGNQNGGGFYIDNAKLNVYMNWDQDASISSSFTLTNSSSISGSGGVFYIQNMAKLQMNSLIISNIDTASKMNGSFIYSKATDLDLQIKNTNLVCTATEKDSNTFNPSILDRGGAIQIEKAIQDVQTSNLTISNCYNALNGGAFSLIKSSLVETGSTITGNSALKGGAIFCDECSLSLTSTKFISNEGFMGGTLYIQTSISSLNLQDITIQNSKVSGTQSTGGSIYLQGNEAQNQDISKTLIISNITVTDTQSGSYGGFISINYPGLQLTLSNVNVTQSSAVNQGGLIYAKNLKSLTVQSPAIYKTISSIGQGQFLKSESLNAEITLTDLQVICSPNNFDSELETQLSSLTSSTGKLGSIIDVVNAKQLSISNLNLNNCYTATNGGVFNLQNVKSFTDQYSTYSNIIAVNGGLGFIQNSDISFSHGTFTNIFANQAGGFYLKDYAPIGFQNCTFTDFYSKTNGGFIETFQSDSSLDPESTNYKLIQSYDITIKNSTFRNFYAGRFGGAFYLNSYYLNNLYLTDVSFYKIESKDHGGVFYITKIRNSVTFSTISIKSQNIFSELYASGQSKEGAFMYSNCNQLKVSLQNTIIECNAKYEEQVNEQVFSTQISLTSVAFSIYNAIGIDSSSNIFRYCFGSFEGSVFNLEMTQFNDQNSEFYFNSALYGGVFYSTSSKINLQGTKIYENSALIGGVFYQTDNTTIITNNVNISSNQAYQQGGVLFSKNGVTSNTNTQKCKYTFTNTVFQNILTREGTGGLAFIDNNLASLYFIKSTISEIFAYESAGFIFTINVQNIEIVNSTLQNIFSSQVAIMVSSSKLLYLTISNSQIQCDTLYDSSSEGFFGGYLDLTTPEFTQASTFGILDAKNISITSSIFSKCGISKSGGLFNLQETSIYISDSVYFDNSAGYGGVIILLHGKVNVQNSKFYGNYASRGAVFYLSDDSELIIKGSSFYENYAYKEAGVIYMETGSYATIKDSEFYKNYAYENSVLQVLEGSKLNNITLDQCDIYQNNAQKNTVSVIQGDMLIKDCSFNKNWALEKTKNIFAGFSNLYIFNTVFRGAYLGKTPLDRLSEELTLGSFIFVILDVNLLIQSCFFQTGVAEKGGAIYISGDATVQIQSSQFSENYSSGKGAAIYGTGFKEISITNDTKFTNNWSNDIGDDICATNSNGILKLQKVSITNPNTYLSIYVDQAQLIMDQVTMKDLATLMEQMDQGSALWCTDCQTIQITKSIFSNSKSNQGGFFYIEESSKSKNKGGVEGKYIIKDSQFLNSYSKAGGAIYLKNTEFVTFENCLFQNNSAYNISSTSTQVYQGSGGSIYYDCDALTLSCQVKIKNSKFIKNYADRQGGAIHWEQLEPIFSGTNEFKDNYAYQYGNNISCFAQKISKIDEQLYKQSLLKIGMQTRLRQLDLISDQLNQNNNTSSVVASQQSGGTIPEMYLSLVDKYGQIVSTDSSSKLRVNVNPIYTQNSKSTVYPPILEGNSQFLVAAGVVQINEIQFTGTPGQKYGLVFTTDGIDSKKKSNKEYLDSLKQSDIDFKLDVELRNCMIGEQFTINGKCQQCQEGSSFSLVQMTSPGSCQTCPSDKANCYGGSNVGPKPGYWRKNNFTSTFVKCQYTSACLGMVPPENNPMGSCQEGYQGILCADCQIQFSRSGDFKCSQCPDKSLNITRLIFIFLAVIFLIVLLVRSTLNGAKDVKNVTSIYIKIMTNHLQLILLTASFNFDWPQMVLDFFSAVKPVAQVSQQIFSFDCFIDGRSQDQKQSSKSDEGSFRIFYQKLIMMAVFPVLLMLCCQVFWALHHKILKIKTKPWNKIVSTVVILLFLVHPNIVQYMFSNFKCIDIDGENRIIDDLEVVCWNTTHKILSYFIALPCIIVWGLGIPFFALVLLMRYRKRLESIEIKQKLGFLYRGYRQEYHFWEIVIMYRKIVLIFVSVFLSNYGVVAQALIVFIILILFLTLNLKAQPFSTIELNDLETLSLISSLITIYCGLFFLSNTKQSLIDTDPDLKSKALQLDNQTFLFLFAMIVLSNFMFFIYWAIKMLQEIRLKLIQKVPKLYLIIFACNNKQSFAKVQEQLKIQDENGSLREQFQKIVTSILNLQKQGKIVLNRQNIEKIQLHLEEQQIIQLMQNPSERQYLDDYKLKNIRRNRRVHDFRTKLNMPDELKYSHMKFMDQNTTENGLMAHTSSPSYMNEKDMSKLDESQYRDEYSQDLLEIDETDFYDYQKKVNMLKKHSTNYNINEEPTKRSHRRMASDYDKNNQTERGSNYNLINGSDDASPNQTNRYGAIGYYGQTNKQQTDGQYKLNLMKNSGLQNLRGGKVNFKRTKTAKEFKKKDGVQTSQDYQKDPLHLLRKSTQIYTETQSPIELSTRNSPRQLITTNNNYIITNNFNNNNTTTNALSDEPKFMYDTINKMMINNNYSLPNSYYQTKGQKQNHTLQSHNIQIQENQDEDDMIVFRDVQQTSSPQPNKLFSKNVLDRLQVPGTKQNNGDFQKYPTMGNKLVNFFSREITDTQNHELKFEDIAKRKEYLMKMEKQNTAIYIQQRGGGNRDRNNIKKNRQRSFDGRQRQSITACRSSNNGLGGYFSSKNVESINKDTQPQNYQRSTLQLRLKDKLRDSFQRKQNKHQSYLDEQSGIINNNQLLNVEIYNDDDEEIVDKEYDSYDSQDDQYSPGHNYSRFNANGITVTRFYKNDFNNDNVHKQGNNHDSVNQSLDQSAFFINRVKQSQEHKKVKPKYVIDDHEENNEEVFGTTYVLGSIDSYRSRVAQTLDRNDAIVILDESDSEENKANFFYVKPNHSIKIVPKHKNSQFNNFHNKISYDKTNQPSTGRRRKYSKLIIEDNQEANKNIQLLNQDNTRTEPYSSRYLYQYKNKPQQTLLKLETYLGNQSDLQQQNVIENFNKSLENKHSQQQIQKLQNNNQQFQLNQSQKDLQISDKIINQQELQEYEQLIHEKLMINTSERQELKQQLMEIQIDEDQQDSDSMLDLYQNQELKSQLIKTDNYDLDQSYIDQELIMDHMREESRQFQLMSDSQKMRLNLDLTFLQKRQSPEPVKVNEDIKEQISLEEEIKQEQYQQDDQTIIVIADQQTKNQNLQQLKQQQSTKQQHAKVSSPYINPKFINQRRASIMNKSIGSRSQSQNKPQKNESSSYSQVQVKNNRNSGSRDRQSTNNIKEQDKKKQ